MSKTLFTISPITTFLSLLSSHNDESDVLQQDVIKHSLYRMKLMFSIVKEHYDTTDIDIKVFSFNKY